MRLQESESPQIAEDLIARIAASDNLAPKRLLLACAASRKRRPTDTFSLPPPRHISTLPVAAVGFGADVSFAPKPVALTASRDSEFDNVR
jgi:hypothetical protein